MGWSSICLTWGGTWSRTVAGGPLFFKPPFQSFSYNRYHLNSWKSNHRQASFQPVHNKILLKFQTISIHVRWRQLGGSFYPKVYPPLMNSTSEQYVSFLKTFENTLSNSIGMVVQWLALSPSSQRVLGFNLTADQGFSCFPPLWTRMYFFFKFIYLIW